MTVGGGELRVPAARACCMGGMVEQYSDGMLGLGLGPVGLIILSWAWAAHKHTKSAIPKSGFSVWWMKGHAGWENEREKGTVGKRCRNVWVHTLITFLRDFTYLITTYFVSFKSGTLCKNYSLISQPAPLNPHWMTFSILNHTQNIVFLSFIVYRNINNILIPINRLD